MSWAMALQYIRACVLGRVTGINSPETAIETICNDIDRARFDLKVVSCTAGNSYWTEDVIKKLEDKVDQDNKLNVEFLVGPKFNNHLLEKLAKEGKIKLLKLRNKPPFDLRIVDMSDTYISNHGGENQKREYCWTFNNLHALNDRFEHYKTIRKDAE